MRVCNCQNLCLCHTVQIRVATSNIIQRAVYSVNISFSAAFTVQVFGGENSELSWSGLGQRNLGGIPVERV